MGSQEHYVPLSAVRFGNPMPLIAQTASTQTLLVKSEPSFSLHTGALAIPIRRSLFSERLFSPIY
jgi:hypothetical protein